MSYEVTTLKLIKGEVLKHAVKNISVFTKEIDFFFTGNMTLKLSVYLKQTGLR